MPAIYSSLYQKYDWTFCLMEWQIDYMKRYQWPGNIRELENGWST